VIPAVRLHAGFETLSGGSVGVDIFFVFSGYLITTSIISELERGDFSIIR
jgi:peptidoglycan/LPS O-acetylase OafA/YrhL